MITPESFENTLRRLREGDWLVINPETEAQLDARGSISWLKMLMAVRRGRLMRNQYVDGLFVFCPHYAMWPSSRKLTANRKEPKT